MIEVIHFETFFLEAASMVCINNHQCWLKINHKLSQNTYNFLIVKLIDFIFKNAMLNFKTELDIYIVSKDLCKTPRVQYLKSLKNIASKTMNEFVEELREKHNAVALIAPETSNNQIELAFIEYCILNKLSFVLIILPSVQVDFLPNILLESINEFQRCTSENLFT